MSDNVTLPGTGVIIATEDLGGGVEIQVNKIAFGSHGSSTDVSSSNPLPVTANAGTGTFTVSGTVTTTPPSNASTNIAQVGGSSVSLGQAVAGSSIPVVLPAAQITTLTPPTSITANRS